MFSKFKLMATRELSMCFSIEILVIQFKKFQSLELASLKLPTILWHRAHFRSLIKLELKAMEHQFSKKMEKKQKSVLQQGEIIILFISLLIPHLELTPSR